VVVTIPGYQKIHRLFESYRLHGRGWVPDRVHAKPQRFDDSRDSKNDSILGARREIQRRRRHAPSCMGATEHQSNWPEMRKTLGKPGFCSGEDRNRTFWCFPNIFWRFERLIFVENYGKLSSKFEEVLDLDGFDAVNGRDGIQDRVLNLSK
jgi:hypothetical protein